MSTISNAKKDFARKISSAIAVYGGNVMKILISSSSENKCINYAKALEYCDAEVFGGYLPKPNSNCDALLICGGNDIEPSLYGEKNKGSIKIDSARDEIEMELIEMYKNKPILGICRGCQILNAFFGGKLDQDIYEKSLHQREDGDAIHRIDVKKGSFLEKLYGESFFVNSAHHQAVNVCGKGFSAVAHSGNIIEAIEHKSKPIYGVQFHPERMMLDFASDKTVDGIKLFNFFINICKKF